MKVEWRPHSKRSGHDWEALYHDGVMVCVRCANCERSPIEVLREDFMLQPCTSEPRPKSGKR